MEGTKELKGNGALDGVVTAAAMALGSLGDPKAIPVMIGVIESDNSYATVYGVGYFGLGSLTGVRYDQLHDGAWWRRWWEKNKETYPAGVRDLPIPDLGHRKSKTAQTAKAATPKTAAPQTVPPVARLRSMEPRTRPIAWLKDKVLAVRSIDPNDDDFRI